MQHDELLRAKRQLGIWTTIVVREFDLINIRSKKFDDGPDLAANETAIGEVGGQRDDIEKIDPCHDPRLLRLPENKTRYEPQCPRSVRHDPAGANRSGSGRSGHVDVQNKALSVLILTGRNKILALCPRRPHQLSAQQFGVISRQSKT